MSDDYPLPLEDWRSKAKCKNYLELFFPSDASAVSPDHPAIKMCRRCPVRQQCLDDALRFDSFEDHGIRGGLTKAQRDTLRRGKPLRRTAEADILDMFAEGDWWTIRTASDRLRKSEHHVRQVLTKLWRQGLIHAEPDPTWQGVGTRRIRYCDPLALREEVAS
jgi:WhiB family redox-sensing transcriptional regulator